MSKVNEGMRKTDEALAELEKRIQKSYNEAGKEIETMLGDYFGRFKSDDEAMLEKVKAGAVSETQYRSWRYGRMARGENYKALRDEIAKRLTNISSVAYSYINDTTPTIYTLNRNYAAYTIERMHGDSVFGLWDESTVRRLIKDQPDLMPNYPAQVAVKRGIDLAFGKKQITASVTSAVIQGKSIPNLASDLRKRITTMSASSAVRTARTAVTAAQNGGTLDTFLSAKEMGIPIKKEWLATLDARTRPAHGKADGQQVDVDEPFVLDGYKLMFPGDKSAPAYLVYNCRCTMVAVVDGVTDRGQRRGRVNGTGENVVLKDMTYSQWKRSKSAGQKSGVPGKPHHIGDIDYSNESEVLSKLDEVRKVAETLSYEINCSVTSDGKVWYVVGEGGFVNPSLIPSSLEGSYSYHNHPPEITNYSFSDDDIVFFLISGEKYSEASDDLFEYTLRSTAATVKPESTDSIYSRFDEIMRTDVSKLQYLGQIDPDLDSYHVAVKILAEELNIKYERKVKPKSP